MLSTSFNYNLIIFQEILYYIVSFIIIYINTNSTINFDTLNKLTEMSLYFIIPYFTIYIDNLHVLCTQLSTLSNYHYMKITINIQIITQEINFKNLIDELFYEINIFNIIIYNPPIEPNINNIVVFCKVFLYKLLYSLIMYINQKDTHVTKFNNCMQKLFYHYLSNLMRIFYKKNFEYVIECYPNTNETTNMKSTITQYLTTQTPTKTYNNAMSKIELNQTCDIIDMSFKLYKIIITNNTYNFSMFVDICNLLSSIESFLVCKYLYFMIVQILYRIFDLDNLYKKLNNIFTIANRFWVYKKTNYYYK